MQRKFLPRQGEAGLTFRFENPKKFTAVKHRAITLLSLSFSIAVAFADSFSFGGRIHPTLDVEFFYTRIVCDTVVDDDGGGAGVQNKKVAPERS